MRIGYCTDLRHAALLADLGYDYIDVNLTVVAQMDEKTFAKARRALGQSGLRAEAFNCFFPGSLRLTGLDVDMAALDSYMRLAIGRAAQLGGEVIVLGSGSSRNVPDGFPADEARAQLVEVCRLAGTLGAAHGIKIAIEPLRTQESNIINLVSHALDLCAEAAHPAVGVLADSFHMDAAGESMDAALRAAKEGKLYHTHIARPSSRAVPCPGDGAEDAYRTFLSSLARAGYKHRVSIEAHAPADLRIAADLALPVLCGAMTQA